VALCSTAAASPGTCWSSKNPRPARERGVYCLFVKEQYRNEKPGAQVPARRVLYDPDQRLVEEAPTAVAVTGDFLDAPSAS
jgi:hypothetical protein